MTLEETLRGSTILVADDNPNNLQVMESMLGKFHCTVRVALDGEAAFRVVMKHPIDLVLLDIHMPKMDGYEVCEKLKADEKTRDIPVIFVTAMSEEFNMVKGFEAGGVDYVLKPVQFEELRARMETHLKLALQQRQLKEQAEELKVMNNTMMGREVRVLELKKEVNDLSRQLGRDVPYPEADE